MKCLPFYLKSDPFRIAYIPNGRWQLQRDTGMKGRNFAKATKEKPAQVHTDRWEPVFRPTTFEVARSQLTAHDTTLRN